MPAVAAIGITGSPYLLSLGPIVAIAIALALLSSFGSGFGYRTGTAIRASILTALAVDL